MHTLSDFQTKPNTCANSVDPDETARNKPSHQDLYALFLTDIAIAAVDMSEFNDGKVHFVNRVERANDFILFSFLYIQFV